MPGPLRLALAFVAGLALLLITAAVFGTSSWSWLLWIFAGLTAGAVAGRIGYIWVAPVLVAAFYLVAGATGLTEDLGTFWLLGAVIGCALVAGGFAVGTFIGWRESPGAAARSAWAGIGRAWRVLIVAAVVLAFAGLAGFTVYLGAVGSEGFTRPATGSANCATPATQFGWEYEAINYEKADDAILVADNADMTDCASQGAGAGDAVVASDGVRLAGWYVPAANGVGPTGPTLLIVPGFNSNKSDVLMFAPSFHDAYNLVLVDLRNQGRSNPADVTMGLHEQWDVAAMLDWLVATKHPSAIAAMGNSMGAATLLAEARTDPRIEAFILDSMHANYEVMLGNALEVDYGYPSVPGAVAIRIGSDVRTGGQVTSIDPVKTIAQLGDRPVLLLHSTTDKIDPPAAAAEKNLEAALDAGVRAELHYCQGLTTGNGSHGHVLEQCPDDWSRWANSFLEGALAD